MFSLLQPLHLRSLVSLGVSVRYTGVTALWTVFRRFGFGLRVVEYRLPHERDTQSQCPSVCQHRRRIRVCHSYPQYLYYRMCITIILEMTDLVMDNTAVREIERFNW